MFAQLKNIFLGAVVALIAVSALSFATGSVDVSAQLVPGSDTICPDGDCPVTGGTDLRDVDEDRVVDILIGAARFLTYIGVGLSVLFMVWGGIRYIIAGSSDGAENAKKILINATIGLVVSIVAFTVVTILAQLLTGNIGETFLNP